MNKSSTKVDSDTCELFGMYSSSKSISALEDDMRDASMEKFSGCTYAWNACTDNDDLMDLFHDYDII